MTAFRFKNPADSINAENTCRAFGGLTVQRFLLSPFVTFVVFCSKSSSGCIRNRSRQPAPTQARFSFDVASRSPGHSASTALIASYGSPLRPTVLGRPGALNLSDPARKDTVNVPAKSDLVVQ